MTQRPIKFLDEKYSVSGDGRVFSNNYNHTGKTKEMRQYIDDGYPYVVLVKDKVRAKVMVHRAVAKLFLSPKPTPKHQVNHINGIRTDNRMENLEWVTSRENTLHGWRVNGRKQSLKARLRASKQMSEMNAKRYAA